MVIIAAVSLKWVPRAARSGWSSVALWSLAAVLFFLPLAAVVLELSTRFSGSGRPLCLDRARIRTSACLLLWWVPLAQPGFLLPSYLLYALANVLTVGGAHSVNLAANRVFSAAIVLAALWVLTALNVRGFQIATWVQGIGTLGIWVPVGLLIVVAVFMLARGDAGNTPRLADLLPHGNVFSAYAGDWS